MVSSTHARRVSGGHDGRTSTWHLRRRGRSPSLGPRDGLDQRCGLPASATIGRNDLIFGRDTTNRATISARPRIETRAHAITGRTRRERAIAIVDGCTRCSHAPLIREVASPRSPEDACGVSRPDATHELRVVVGACEGNAHTHRRAGVGADVTAGRSGTRHSRSRERETEHCRSCKRVRTRQAVLSSRRFSIGARRADCHTVDSILSVGSREGPGAQGRAADQHALGVQEKQGLHVTDRPTNAGVTHSDRGVLRGFVRVVQAIARAAEGVVAVSCRLPGDSWV